MKTQWIKSLLILGTGALLSSCMGQDSNPMHKYSNLKTGEPTTEQSEVQDMAKYVFTSATVPINKEFADLKIQGTNEVNNANFMEGQEGTLYFKLTPTSTKITQYEIKIVDFPIGAQPENTPKLIKTSIDGVHGVQWTPARGIIPSGNYISLKLQIQTTVMAATDPNLVGLVKSDFLKLDVYRNNSVPKILGKSSLASGIEEGQSVPVPFTVDIEDPSSLTNQGLPAVQITSYFHSNTEAYRADGASFVKPDYSKTNPQKINDKGNQWRFHFVVKVDQLPLDQNRLGKEDPLSPSVDVCFFVHATSVIRTESGRDQVCFKGRYAAQLPVLDWENDALKEIKAGGPTLIKFKIASSNGRGKVEIKNMASQIAGLTGKKVLVCTPDSTDSKASQTCELTWTPTCLKSPLNKKLTLKVDNVTGNKTKSQSFSRDLVVVPSEENCPTPPPATPPLATKPATAKPAAAKSAAPSSPVKSSPQAPAVKSAPEKSTPAAPAAKSTTTKPAATSKPAATAKQGGQ
ncbi:MAG: hypothetical protein JNL11_05925 [Bdellovibrionaceae bacterium]|nr:hypothetical protein [Pseudobdellovibrionaceae bacterium]